MSHKTYELEDDLRKILATMLDDESNEADIQRLLRSANWPATLVAWRQYCAERAALSGEDLADVRGSALSLDALHQRIDQIEAEGKAAAPAPANRSSRWHSLSFAWLMNSRLQVAAMAAVAVTVVALAVTFSIDYSSTNKAGPEIASVSNGATATAPATAADAQFVQRRLSVYALNHANNRVVSTHFVPFTKMSTYHASLVGGGINLR